MSGRNVNGPQLNLRLNLSPPRMNNNNNHHHRGVESPTRSSSTESGSLSPQSSCVSSELNQDDFQPETTPSMMVVVGCKRCHMFVMIAEDNQRCPKCKGTVLVDVNGEHIKNDN